LYLKGKAFYALSNEVLTTLLLQKIRTIWEKPRKLHHLVKKC